MTTNAIEFQKLQESMRHNLEQEAYNKANIDVEHQKLKLGYSELAEAARKNTIQQQYNVGWLAETGRHNLEAERQGRTQNTISAVDTGVRGITGISKEVRGWFDSITKGKR